MVRPTIILWNTVYLSGVIDPLPLGRQRFGRAPRPRCPCGWEYVSLIADYLWRDIDNPVEMLRSSLWRPESR